MAAASHLDVLRRVLLQPTGGVTGLVDELLAVCREHDLELDWQPDRYRLRSAGGGWEELADMRLGKSVFRAILARVAALCNERTPNSVSPYGGRGELPAGRDSPAVFEATFVNTPAKQQLKLRMEREPVAAESSVS